MGAVKKQLLRVKQAIARRFRYVKTAMTGLFLPLSGRPRLPWLYYAVFNPAMKREQRAVMAGRLAFEQSKASVGLTNSLLRRNTHRLEKGLVMRPRRDIFGLDYIAETIAKYCAVAVQVEHGEVDRDSEFEWFRDVLSTYFSVTASHPVIDTCRDTFNEIEKRLSCQRELPDKVPHPQAFRKHANISYKEFLDLCKQRKSVRWFSDRRVGRDLVCQALEAARYAPSACNRYPYFFHVFDEKEKVEIVSTLPGGTVGFAQNFPVIIAIIGELRNYYGERDRHLIYIDASLAAMSVVLAAETLGLATCCINWPDIEEHEQRAERLLKLEPDQRPVMFMAMGYPDPEGLVCWSEKKPVSDICRFNSALELPES